MVGIVGHGFTCPGCGIKEWSPADQVFHACPQFDGQEAEMVRGRKSTRQPPKDGKCKVATLALIGLSDDEFTLALATQRWERSMKGTPWPERSRPSLGVLTECKCPVRHFVSPASVRRKCLFCNTWRKRV